MDGQSSNAGLLLTPRGVTIAGMATNAALSLSKILVGVLFRSQAILADGFHSASDLASDAAVLAGLRVSGRPADSDHHYGHRRVSTLVALAVGVFVFLRIRRSKAETQKTEIVQKIDLSGDIELEKMKCQNCSAELSKDSITVKEGAIFIDCPYCGTSYQMVEEPKW